MGNSLVADKDGNLILDRATALQHLRTGEVALRGFKKLYPTATSQDERDFKVSLESISVNDFEVRAARTPVGALLIIKTSARQIIMDAVAILEPELSFTQQDGRPSREELSPVLFLEGDASQEEELFSMLSYGITIFFGRVGTKFNIFGKQCTVFTLSPISLDSLVRVPMESVSFGLLVETAHRLEIVLSKEFNTTEVKYLPSKSLKDVQKKLEAFSYLGPLKASDYI